MPRGPRLDYADALHHVMARGIEKREIFSCDRDREDLLNRLERLVDETATSIFAWCLIPNHFHLLLRSGPAGLSPFMRRLQTGYAVSFNKRHRRVGHIFQNRYKSIVVEEDRYLLQLVRYLHLNPLRAGLVKDLRALEAFPWSGHSVLLGRREAAWQDTRYVLGQFGRDVERARVAYGRFVKEGAREGKRTELNGGGLVRSIGGRERMAESRSGPQPWVHDERVLGSSEFVRHVTEAEGEADEGASLRVGEPGRNRFLQKAIAEVSRRFRISPEELQGGGRRRKVVVARAALAWVATRLCGIPTIDVARATGVTPVSILRVEERGRAELAERGIDPRRFVQKCK